MTTLAKSIPVVAGGAGAPVDASDLAAEKTFTAEGLVGVVEVQAAINGAWCTLFSFRAGGSGKQVEKVVADQLRVNAGPSGDAASVTVSAERSASRFASLPAGSPGAAVDVSEFGELNSVFAPTGNSKFEISEDGGTSWVQCGPTFTGPGCQKLMEFSATMARADGDALELGAQESAAGAALSEPRTMIVYRPGATGADAPGGNVYTTWEEAYAAIEAVRPFGPYFVAFDSRFSTYANAGAVQACLIPAGVYDMSGAILTSTLDSGEISTVDFEGGAKFENVAEFRGRNLQFSYDALTGNGYGAVFELEQGQFVLLPSVSEVRFYNNVVGAEPMFAAKPGTFQCAIGSSNAGSFGKDGPFSQAAEYDGASSPSPLIDVTEAFLFTVGGIAGYAEKNVFSGSGLLFLSDYGTFGDIGSQFSYADHPAFTGQAISVLNYSNTKVGIRVNTFTSIPIPVVGDEDILGFGDLQLVDVTLNPVTLRLLSAFPMRGSINRVKDYKSNASVFPITVIPQTGQTIDFDGTPLVSATGTLTLTGNVSDGDQVKIGSKVYTFQAVLTDVDGNVLIGASASDSIDNLIAAINLGAGAGVVYAASTTANPNLVTAAAGAGDTMDATADFPGLGGNSIITTDPVDVGAVMSWGAGTLTGGTGGIQITADAGALEFIANGDLVDPNWSAFSL